MSNQNSNHKAVDVKDEGLLTRAQAKARLRRLGWTIRDGAAAVGLKAHMSLHRILTGEYQNRRVLRAIAVLGPSPRKPYERRKLK